MHAFFIVWHCTTARSWQRVAVLTDRTAAEKLAAGRTGWFVLSVVDVRLTGKRIDYPTGSRSGVDA
jgi:hypothetical protein